MSDEKEDETPKKKGKLPLILGAVVVMGLGAGGGWYFTQGKAPDKDADKAAKAEPAEEIIEVDLKQRTFVTLEPFIFNLQDEDQDRYGQVKVVLEVANQKVETDLGTVSPAIRNAMLMLLSSKTSREVLSNHGKRDLATEMVDATNAILAGKEPPPVLTAEQRKKKRAAMRKLIAQMAKEDPDFELDTGPQKGHYPPRVRAAHFSQFIVQ